MKSLPISICMIGKNEERYLEKTLQAASDFVSAMPGGSEIVFVDTGSVDRTKEIAKKYTGRIYDFAWCDDFSAARNFSLSKARNDMTLSLDCDEVILPCDIKAIGKNLALYREYLGQVTIRSRLTKKDGGETFLDDAIRRVFDKRLYQFKGIIHEQILPIHPRELMVYPLPIVLDHYGYLGTPEEQQKKSERNIHLLKQAVLKEPNDPYHYVQLGQSYRAIADHEKAAEYYEKACNLEISPELPYAGEMLIGYGKSLIALGRITNAQALLDRFYPDYFTSSDLFCLAGDIRRFSGEPIKAMLDYINAILCPVHYQEGMNSYIPYFQIGFLYEAMGQKEQAIENYRKCGDYPPALEYLKRLEA